jgi:hypothetical protein
MSLLYDIRNGNTKRLGVLGGGGAVVFWMIVGVALGVGMVRLFEIPEPVTTFIVAIVALAGGCVGLYAGWGTTTFARILAVPGAVLELIW